MFVLVTYDVPAERTHIYRKLLRKRLEHLQQSVFYGDITEGQLVGIKQDIKSELIDEDSIYIFRSGGLSCGSTHCLRCWRRPRESIYVVFRRPLGFGQNWRSTKVLNNRPRI